ncbi:MAG: glutamyl-tRNA reductase [Oscillospiraceae bacterium]|nr:glutamyl-tRNA reductase [Oscillospiraceae bacterium]
MSVMMIGVDHNRANLDVRGVFSFTKKMMEEAYARARELSAVSGSVILSTCNRMEWWLSVPHERGLKPLELLCGFLGVDADSYRPFFVERRDDEAVEHLFRLTAGLESRIVGEDQILTQVGDALKTARVCCAADHVLEVLFRLAVTAGKRVRTETDLSTADSSVIHAALRALEAQGFDVKGRKCLVIGNGMMGRLSANALIQKGADVTVTVRQYHSGIVDIPFGCKRINYTDRYGFIPSCDLVVSATSSPNYTLTVPELTAMAPHGPICLVDLAVPRDIEVEAGALPGFTLYDIDAFHIDVSSDRLRRNIALAESILEEEKREFYSWYNGQDMIPRIQSLKETAAKDVDARLTPVYRGIPLTGDQKENLVKEVDGAAQRMMNRLLFGLRARLPDSVFSECVQAMEHVFRDQA